MGHSADQNGDERAAVERYLAGDAEGFRALFRMHSPRLLRIAIGAGLDRAAAEDVVQATFLRVHQSRDRIDPARPFRPWLVTIALNLVRDGARQAARHHAREDALATRESGRVARPDEVHDARELGSLLADRLAGLPEAQREAVVAVRLGGLSYPEAAEALGRSEAAVRQNVHRGLVRLADAVADEGAVTDGGSRRTGSGSR